MLTSFRPRMALGVLVLTGGIALLAPGCSSDDDGGSTSSTPFGGKKVESTIGPNGGTLTSADGNVVVVVPAGALATDTALFVEPASGVPSGALAAVELGPTGTAFALPAQITISFASLELDKIDLGKFRLGTVVSGVWQAVPGSSVDTAARKVTGETTHFSPWGVLSDPGGPAPDAGPCTTQNMCAEGCGCDPQFKGASCTTGTVGQPGCSQCACDGVKFSCSSCEASDGGTDAPVSDGGGSDAPADTGGGPTCKPTQSCNQKTMNQSCQDYDAATPAATVQSACAGGTYSAAPCDRTASLGGCESSGPPCLVVWYFPGINPWTVADIQTKCKNQGKAYVAP